MPRERSGRPQPAAPVEANDRHAMAVPAQRVECAGIHRVICETGEMHRGVTRHVPENVERPNPIAFVRRVGQSVRDVQDRSAVSFRHQPIIRSRGVIQRVVVKGVAHSAEGELTEQPVQLLFRRGEVHAVTPTRQRGAGQPRLIRVELPRVDVKGERSATLVDLPQPPCRPTGGVQAEVPAAGDGKVDAIDAAGRGRELPQCAARRRSAVRAERRVGNPVAIVVNREDARVAMKPFLREDLQGPKRLSRDRKARAR